MKIRHLAVALATTISLAGTASASTVVGSIDWVDQDSILGWACYRGEPYPVLPVQIWGVNTTTGQWIQLGYEFAERGRLDVGNSGQCGYGTYESPAYFHGFEMTIYPPGILASQGTYLIYAYAYGQQLPGSGTRSVSFAASGFPTSDTWRTDYDNRFAKNVAMVSCIWPFKGANPTRGVNDHYDQHFLNAGATILQQEWEAAPGLIEGPMWCLSNNPASPASWYWDQPNSATNASTWPMSNYWVISANNEFAYSKTQSGPPSQSQPVNTGGMYSLSNEKGNFYLGIDNRKTGYRLDGTPFLSFGAQMGRGVAGPISFLHNQMSRTDTYLEFQVQQLTQSSGHYHDAAVYVEMMWGGYKRWVGVSLSQATQARFHWNWNALESFWFPGGEFNILGTSVIQQTCNLGNAQLPVLSQATVGQTLQVSIPLSGLLQCIENQYIVNNNAGGGRVEWSSPRPTTVPVAITGVQLAIEQAPGQPNAFMTTRFTKPTLVTR